MPASSPTRTDLDSVTDAVLSASRVLVSVAARSLAEAEEEVSLAQYRVLVVLASRGPQRLADLAEALAVQPSTATRVSDRLVRKRLVRRQRASADRREVRLTLTGSGRQLVDRVTRRRRAEIARLIAALDPDERHAVVAALRALTDAAGEVPDPDWALGW
ncbi:MAG TPA: MarR family transcriptional regulator [Acidimicrobiales bacterium]|nr:MarR family transcriptional regulator [Acidimicrobiales bacterium]